MNPKQKKPDYTKLDNEFLSVLQELHTLSPEAKALEIQSATMKYLKALCQEMVLSKGETDEIMEKMGNILDSTQKTLSELANKPETKIPSNEPIAKALSDGLKEISTKFAKLDIKPQITVTPTKVDVPAPQVKVAAPNVDVTVDVDKITDLLSKELPDMVQQIVDNIPEQDNSDVETAIKSLKTTLATIARNTSMVPQAPTSMVISSMPAIEVDIPPVTVDTTGLATDTKQDVGNASLASIDGKITAVNTGAVVVSSSALPTGAATSANQQTDALTDTQLRATPVPISGSVTADLGANNDVTVTSGAITETNSTAILADTANMDTNLGTIAGAVSGTEMQVDIVSGGQTDALTDTELRATPVPVSGTVTANTGLTQPTTPSDTQPVSNATLTELGDAINGNQVDVDIKASDLDLMLGTDFSAVFGVNTLLTTTQADARANTTDAFTVNSWGQVFNGTTWDRQRGDATDGTLVNLGANNDVSLNAGTNAIGKLAANSGVDIGDVDVTSSVSATLDHGSNLDIDTTAEQITTTSFAAKFGVTVKSAVDNTDTVYVGNSDVTAGTTAATDGFPLEPGESITLPVNNSNLLYAIGAAANQKVFWSAV